MQHDDQDLVTYARRGVWTPWGEVLCLACDYARIEKTGRNLSPSDRKYVPDPGALVECLDGRALAKCDECQSSCWVRKDVATLQAILLMIGDLDERDDVAGTSLWQSGGMCCALVVDCPDGRKLCAASNDENSISVAEYRNQTEFDEGEHTRAIVIPTTDPASVEHAARTFIEWARGSASEGGTR